MFLVRIPGSDRYAEYAGLYVAAGLSAEQNACAECETVLRESDPAVTLRYPSANRGSGDTYLVTVCPPCSAPVAARIAASMAEQVDATVGDLPF